MPDLTISEIARLAGGEIHGPSSGNITGVAPLQSAGSTDLSFVANPRYLPYLHDCRAGAVLVPAALADRAPEGLTRIVVADPHIALYRILPHLYPAAEAVAGIHPTAVVDPTAELGPGVQVSPYVVIGARARIGERCSIGAGTVIGDGCLLGAETVVHPHVTIYPGVRLGARCVVHSGSRLGRDGFGFVWSEDGHRKVPQVGGCVIEDDVEVGCNVTIDRGSIGNTVVGRGTKMDNLVHLGHNVQVGRHSLITAQVGISGSTRLGDGVVLGGQAGVGGHLEIGARARIGGQAGVIGDVPAGESYSGYPARPHREALRAQGALFRLPELMKRVKALERAILGSRD
jgi:UDP-3-O-[3-hydroxymyristoyl] glucosamine N-acyltransferase